MSRRQIRASRRQREAERSACVSPDPLEARSFEARSAAPTHPYWARQLAAHQQLDEEGSEG